jgi:hypothetical protein
MKNEVFFDQVSSLDVEYSGNLVYEIRSHFATLAVISATVFGYFFAYVLSFSFDAPFAQLLTSATIFSSGIPLYLHG